MATGKLSPLISVISASGGAGKSAIALMASYLASREGISCALVEADLQFGDIGFWLALDEALPTLASGRACEPLDVAPNLHLYKAPCFPEVAEEVSDDVARLVASIRAQHDLVIADTGAFWSGLTADLLVSSDLFWLVCDQRPSSVAGAVRASELCRRIGVAGMRRMCVYNRWTPKARVAPDDVMRALDADAVQRVPDGKQLVDELLCAGDVEELVVLENPFACGVDTLLKAALPRVGRAYGGIGGKRMGRGGRA